MLVNEWVKLRRYSAAFLFFIHFTLFTVQEAMPQPKKFVPAVSKAFFLAMIVSCVFGILGAFGFGPGVKSVVITMLDVGLCAKLNAAVTHSLKAPPGFSTLERIK